MVADRPLRRILWHRNKGIDPFSPMTIGRNDPCPCGSGKNTRNAASKSTPPRSAPRPRPPHRRRRKRVERRKRPRTPSANKRRVNGRNGSRRSNLCPTSIPNRRPRSLTGRRSRSGPGPRGCLVEGSWTGLYGEETREETRGQAAWLLQRTLEFLEQQPRLFRHLYLHDEFLFELGGALARAGRLDDYLALLRRLRREQPDTYLQCFGYYDHDLIAEAIRSGGARKSRSIWICSSSIRPNTSISSRTWWTCSLGAVWKKNCRNCSRRWRSRCLTRRRSWPAASACSGSRTWPCSRF